MKTLKLLICGSRSFNDFELLENEVSHYLFEIRNEITKVVIISGCANGADLLGEEYAKSYQLEVERYSAEWNKFGKRAGYIRNEQMVKECDACIAFWDQKSKGTKHTINLCKKYNKPLKVINFESNIEKIKEQYERWKSVKGI